MSLNDTDLALVGDCTQCPESYIVVNINTISVLMKYFGKNLICIKSITSEDDLLPYKEMPNCPDYIDYPQFLIQYKVENEGNPITCIIFDGNVIVIPVMDDTDKPITPAHIRVYLNRKAFLKRNHPAKIYEFQTN